MHAGSHVPSQRVHRDPYSFIVVGPRLIRALTKLMRAGIPGPAGRGGGRRKAAYISSPSLFPSELSEK